MASERKKSVMSTSTPPSSSATISNPPTVEVGKDSRTERRRASVRRAGSGGVSTRKDGFSRTRKSPGPARSKRATNSEPISPRSRPRAFEPTPVARERR